MLAAALGSASCAPTVLDPIQPGSPGTGAGGASTGSAGTGNAGGMQMLAILAKDVPPTPASSPDPPVVFFPPTNGDPDALMLVFSSETLSCADPFIGCSGDSTWEKIIALPSDLVRVGPIDLGNPRVTMTDWQLFNTGVGQCGGGGGGGFGVPSDPGKTLQITSTDAGSISVTLSGGVQAGLGGTVNGMPIPIVSLDGSYTVSRCEPAPAPPAPKAAVAILGSKLPAGLPANPTIGTTVDPTALYVFLGTGTQTCAAPLSDLGCSGAGRIVAKIPATLQQPGTIQLSDPQVAASAEVVADAGTPNCTTSTTASFSQGTLTIRSVDTTGLTFTLYESGVANPAALAFDADGLYQATICP
jgi:hypothetical protein